MHVRSVEGNLEGNNANREVIVILPPGYQHDTRRRYPVVYALHGYSIGAEQWIHEIHEIHVPQTIEGALAKGSREFMVVFPDSKTVHNGSMYSRSVTTGDFETFIAVDLVQFIDNHFRTIPERRSRGLAGHSMGGYGAARIGMKYPRTVKGADTLSCSATSSRHFHVPSFVVSDSPCLAADQPALPCAVVRASRSHPDSPSGHFAEPSRPLSRPCDKCDQASTSANFHLTARIPTLSGAGNLPSAMYW